MLERNQAESRGESDRTSSAGCYGARIGPGASSGVGGGDGPRTSPTTPLISTASDPPYLVPTATRSDSTASDWTIFRVTSPPEVSSPKTVYQPSRVSWGPMQM